MRTEKAVPTKPENKANIKYNVPISFAFEDKNHLSFHIVILVRLSLTLSLSILSSLFVLETIDPFQLSHSSFKLFCFVKS
jgi:hypothetical protein